MNMKKKVITNVCMEECILRLIINLNSFHVQLNGQNKSTHFSCVEKRKSMTNEELKKIVGRNVRKYRLIYNAYNKEKLTQKGLAEKIGARTPLIGALESENSDMGVSIYNLYMISKVLNVPINKFFEEE